MSGRKQSTYLQLNVKFPMNKCMKLLVAITQDPIEI